MRPVQDERFRQLQQHLLRYRNVDQLPSRLRLTACLLAWAALGPRVQRAHHASSVCEPLQADVDALLATLSYTRLVYQHSQHLCSAFPPQAFGADSAEDVVVALVEQEDGYGEYTSEEHTE